MPVPDFIQDFPDGDGDTVPWSTRLPQGGSQWLLDVMADWNMPNKSKTVRWVLALAHEFFDDLMKKKGRNIGPKLEARMKYNKSKYEADERDRMIRDLGNHYRRAMDYEHLPTRQKLLEAGEELAAAHGVKWPPEERTFLERDSAARYILDRVLLLIDRSEDRSITFRDLVANSVGDKDKIKPILEALMEKGYILMDIERRSGPPTVWITVPMLEIIPTSIARDG